VILRREVFEKVGFLDENFTPAWYEDDDYSFRVLYAGYKNAIANRSFVFHNQSTTSSKLPEKEKIIERNRQYFYDKHPLGKCFHEMYKKNYTSAMIKKFFVLKFR
jgi:GT2 family glycosyltransferase